MTCAEYASDRRGMRVTIADIVFSYLTPLQTSPLLSAPAALICRAAAAIGRGGGGVAFWDKPAKTAEANAEDWKTARRPALTDA